MTAVPEQKPYRRPHGWREQRACGWCQTPFIATPRRPQKRYCSRACGNKAKCIEFAPDYYVKLGQLASRSVYRKPRGLANCSAEVRARVLAKRWEGRRKVA